MAVHRGSFRVRVGLTGRVFPDAGDPGLLVRAVDLSRTGVGLVCVERAGLSVGDLVRIALDDDVDGHPVGRQWSGRVAHARELDGAGEAALRLGIAFEWPDGPGARPRSSRREAAAADAAGVAASGGSAGGWLAPAVGLAGFAADQASKAWAASAVAGLGGGFDLAGDWLVVAPADNPGTLAGLAAAFPLTAPLCAAGGLTLAALAAPRLRALRTAPAAAAGLLAAGLLGNSADRLALGYVRDFLVCGCAPQWSFNLADLFLVSGSLAVLATRLADAAPLSLALPSSHLRHEDGTSGQIGQAPPPPAPG